VESALLVAVRALSAAAQVELWRFHTQDRISLRQEVQRRSMCNSFFVSEALTSNLLLSAEATIRPDHCPNLIQYFKQESGFRLVR
jgi:hypothetical protein